MTSSLEQLRKFSVVVADTGDFESMSSYKPTDATTNPSLILQTVQKPQYENLFLKAVEYGKSSSLPTRQDRLNDAADHLSVLIGLEVLKIIPGRVSTEVDARLSFDTQALLDRARSIIKRYESFGINKDRILIKLATTWQGIQAAQILEKEGIHCNMTLLFNLAQAIGCAEAGVTLISPFVGRIYDYYNIKHYENPFEDPGVKNVTEIFKYYKYYDYGTQIMGASFRNISQIKCLSGCDLLTISPSLLNELEKETSATVNRELDVEKVKKLSSDCVPEKKPMTESRFYWLMNEDEMAGFKLAEGIRKFAQDQQKLEKLFLEKWA